MPREFSDEEKNDFRSKWVLIKRNKQNNQETTTH